MGVVSGKGGQRQEVGEPGRGGGGGVPGYPWPLVSLEVAGGGGRVTWAMTH